MNALTTNGSRFNLLPMNVLSHEMNRWIDELSREPAKSNMAAASIWEDDSSLYLEIDLPGVHVDDIELSVLENRLQITANRSLPADKTYLVQERKVGLFERPFRFPVKIDESSIQAEMNAGVLTVTVPKSPEAQVKKIEIKPR